MAAAYSMALASNPDWRRGATATPEDLQYSGLLQQHPEWWDQMRGDPRWDNSPMNPRFSATGSSLVSAGPVSSVSPLVTRRTTRNTMPVGGASALSGQPKSPLQAAGINDLYGQYVNAETPKRQSLTDFTAALLKTQPANQAANQSDQNYIGSVYSDGGVGSLQGALDRIARQRAAASNVAAGGALRSALRTYNINRMGGGNSSYLDRAYGQNLAQIAAQNAGQLSQDQLANQMTLLNARTGLLGKRQGLNQAYLDSTLYPYNTQNSLIKSDADVLGQLGSLEAFNQPYAPNPLVRWSLR